VGGVWLVGGGAGASPEREMKSCPDKMVQTREGGDKAPGASGNRRRSFLGSCAVMSLGTNGRRCDGVSKSQTNQSNPAGRQGPMPLPAMDGPLARAKVGGTERGGSRRKVHERGEH